MRICEGDPLEIYTSNDGEVIFKTYSAISEMSDGAAQIAEVIHKMANLPSVVFDRDHVVAVAGVQKKEFNERRISNGLEELLENKNIHYTKVDRENPSRMLVSEMMILANTLMAEFLKNNDMPGVFRSQAQPKQRSYNFV